MAKPAKVKKTKQAQADTAARTPAKARPKAEAKAAPAEAKGLRARISSKAQEGKAAKPAKTKVSGKVAPQEKRSAAKFLREVRVEMSKVTWPTREELISSTIVVVIAVAIAGVYIAVFDAVFSRLISWLG